MAEITYRGYRITYDPPPIPARDCDWHFVHEDYDEGDRRHGHAASLNDAKNEIDLIEDENEPDPWKLTRELAAAYERMAAADDPDTADHSRRIGFELRCLLARVEYQRRKVMDNSDPKDAPDHA